MDPALATQATDGHPNGSTSGNTIPIGGVCHVTQLSGGSNASSLSEEDRERPLQPSIRAGDPRQYKPLAPGAGTFVFPDSVPRKSSLKRGGMVTPIQTLTNAPPYPNPPPKLASQGPIRPSAPQRGFAGPVVGQPAPNSGALSTSAGNLSATANFSVANVSVNQSMAALKRTPAQLVLQNVFARFVKAAESKVNTLIYLQPFDREIDLFAPIRPEADLALDSLLESVGSVAKHCPKLMIDSIMVWRKSKSEASAADSVRNLSVMYPHLRGKDLENVLKERKSLVANFILCRVLIAIIQRLTRETLPDDLEEKLEDMVIGQLRNADPDLMVKSMNRQANFDLFAELVGALSAVRFASVSARFITELSRGAQLKEGKLDLIIRSMRFLKLKIYPMDALEDTADFLQTCGELFQHAHSSRIKQAYADVFVQLLNPIAAIATAEVNLPAWMKTVELIFPKANKMLSKPRYLTAAIPLLNTLLCVSRKDFFHKHWGDFIEFCFKQLREKSLRTLALTSISRLLWVYLFRCTETSSANIYRRIDTITRALFPPNRRGVMPAESGLLPFVQIVYFVCVRYPEYGINNILMNLLGIEAMSANVGGGTSTTQPQSTMISTSGILTGEKSPYGGGSGPYADDWTTSSLMTQSPAGTSNMVIGDSVVNPERLIIALRAFLMLLADMEDALGGSGNQKDTGGLTAGTVSAVSGSSGNSKVVVEAKVNLLPPVFPTQDTHLLTNHISIGVLNSIRRRPGDDEKLFPNDIRCALPDHVALRMGASMRDSIDRFNDTIGKVAVALDNACGWALLTDTGVLLSGTGLSSSASTVSSSTTLTTSVAMGIRRVSITDTSLLGSASTASDRDLRINPADLISRDRQLLYDLIHTYVDCLPRVTPTGLRSTQIIDMLCRYVVHVDEGIRIAAANALKRICIVSPADGQAQFWKSSHAGTQCGTIAGDLVRTVASTGIGILNDRYADVLTNLHFDGSQGATWHILSNYISLLEIWLAEVHNSKKIWDTMEAEWVVEETESRGLLFLCSQVPQVRKRAIRILQLADQLERALKGRPLDDFEDQFPGLTKAEAKRQTLRRQSKIDMRRQFTLPRNVFHPHLKLGSTRVGRIMEECGPDLVRRHYYDPVLASSTQSEHQKFQQQQRQQLYMSMVSAKDTLMHLAGSDVPQDATIWNRCFPDLVKWCFQYASPRAMQMCLREVCSRLLTLQPSVMLTADQSGQVPVKVNTGTVKSSSAYSGKAPTSAPTLTLTDEMIDQWKVYMVFACASIEITRVSADSDKRSEPSTVGVSGAFLERGKSDFRGDDSPKQQFASGVPLMTLPIASARSLFQMVFPLLSSDRSSIRQAAVTALGAIHWMSYQTFLEDVQPYMRSVVEDLRNKSSGGPRNDFVGKSKANSSQAALLQSVQARRAERLRMELTHVLSLVADFVDHLQYRCNDSLMAGVIMYIREMARFLSDPEVQLEWDHQMLRYYFSGFVERLCDHLDGAITTATKENEAGTKNAPAETLERYLSFDLRLGLFQLFEQWCGYGQFSNRTRDREAKMMLAVLDQVKDIRERGALTSTMEEQRKALETASLKAMAALCKGTVVNPKEPDMSFDFKALVTWVDSIFSSPDEKFHVIARAALEALLSHNRTNTNLLNDVIRQCYIGDTNSNVTMGYFMALVDIFVQEDAYPCSPARICALGLYKAGDPSLHIRRGAVRLLRAIENRFWGDKTNTAQYGAVRNMMKQFFGPPPQLSDIDAHMLDHQGGGLDSRSAGVAGLGGNHDGLDNEAAIMAAMALIDEEHATYEAAAIASSLPIVYKYAQAMVSARLANERPEMTCEILSEMVRISELVVTGNGQRTSNAQGIRDILTFMVPWVRNVELDPISRDAKTLNTPISDTEIILNNLFYLTVKYGDDYVLEVEAIWTQLMEPSIPDTESTDGNSVYELKTDPMEDPEVAATLERHVHTAVDFLLEIGVQKRNPKFVMHAKKIMVYISRTPGCAMLVDSLVERITPRSLVPGGMEIAGANEVLPPALDIQRSQRRLASPELHMADLEQVLVDMPKRPAFSRGQLACVLLVDLAVEVGAALRPHLPLLLHIIFVQLDHFITLICEQNRLLLINLIQAIVPRDVAGAHIDTIHAALSLKEGKRLWPYEDVTPKMQEIESEHQLGALVVDVLDLLSVVDPNLVQSWGEKALIWATGCPVRHVACRSLQIFRALMPAFSQSMLGDLLQRLANTLADPVEEIQGFALENLSTISAMIDSLDGYRLMHFPQLFWAATACIYSPLQWEYLEGVRLLQKILRKMDLSDARCRNILLINLPTKWRGGFTGLQKLLLRGLSSSATERVSVKLLNDLVEVEDGPIVDISSARWLYPLLANVPHWLQVFDPPSATPPTMPLPGDKERGLTREECLSSADRLAEAVGKKGLSGLQRLLASYAKQRMRSKDDFLRQFVSLVKESFFPMFEVEALQFLMGLLTNNHRPYKKRVLAVIKEILPVLEAGGAPWSAGDGRKLMFDGDSRQSTILNQPSNALNSLDEDMIAPLLATLQTDLAADALEVVDQALGGTIAIGESNLRLVFGGKSIYKIAREAGNGLESLSANLATGASGVAGISTGSGGSSLSSGSSMFSAGNKTEISIEDGGWSMNNFTAEAKAARYNMAGVASTCGGRKSSSHKRNKSRGNDNSGVESAEMANPNSSSTMLIGGAPARKESKSGKNAPGLRSAPPYSNTPSSQDGGWKYDDGNTNILDTLNELDAFFGSESNWDGQSYDETSQPSSPKFQAPRRRSSLGLDSATTDAAVAASKGHQDKQNSIDDEPQRRDDASFDEVSYSAESLGHALSRDASLSSLMVDGILDDSDLGDGMTGDAANLRRRKVVINGTKDAARRRPARPVSASLAPLPVVSSNIPAASSGSPARRLLSHASALAFVTFRLKTPYEQLVQDTEFAHWLRSDLAKVLKVAQDQVVLEKVEAEGTGQSPGVFITAVIKGTDGEQNPQGILSAAYAEELAALICGGMDEDEQGATLFQGVVTWNIDAAWIPEIFIGFMGITVPYLPEGLRYDLPYRQQRRTTKTLPPIPNTPLAGFPLTPDILSPRMEKATLFPSSTRTDAPETNAPEFSSAPTSSDQLPTQLTPESAIEVFRIFPASFELVIQLLEDWVGFAADILSHSSNGGGSEDRDALNDIVREVDKLRSRRQNESSGAYKPPLVDEPDGGISLEIIAQRLLAYQQADPTFLQNFLTTRQRHVSNMNTQVTHYLSRRHAVSDYGGADAAADRERQAMELGISVVELYEEVLRLEGLLESFLGSSQAERLLEVAAVQDCRDVCTMALNG
ncbi:cell morphogenesis N-terminal-domain-containing protein [Phlyctochytrium arcticum]|nr:cell morphogenesis N-terminal-domain-containing protein [Phlyctochytrium arcticum]